MRLTPEELEREEAKIASESDAKITAFRHAIHEYILIEAGNSKIRPHEATIAIVEEAGLCVGASAAMAECPTLATIVLISQFLRVVGYSTNIPEIKQLGDTIMNQVKGTQ